jgi:hypothetical protein
MRLFNALSKRPSRPHGLRARPRVEELETRVVPYATSGNAWLPANGVSNQVLTLSFVPDGTWMTSGTNGNVSSDTFAKFNARFGSTAAWQNVIVTALQSWAQYANLNFAVVSDNGTASGQGNYQQGDPGMGDIRVASYPMTGGNVLGLAYYPPPANNYSIAGDIDFNSNLTYNINGSNYDLEAVAFHEFGHALGLAHSGTYGAVMYPSYTGSKRALTNDDIQGIQAIYGAPTGDSYGGVNAPVPNNSFQNAADISSHIGQAGTAQLTNLDLYTVGQAEYFKFTAPPSSGSTLTVSVQSSGLSLLRPSVTVYAADMTTVLGSGSAAGSYNGGTITLNVSGVGPGQTFYVKVTGADTTAFSIGAYALTLNLGTGPLPGVPLPNTQTANGAVTTGGGGVALIGKLFTTLGLGGHQGNSSGPQGDYFTIDGSEPPAPVPPPPPGATAPGGNGAVPYGENGPGGEGLDHAGATPGASPQVSFVFASPGTHGTPPAPGLPPGADLAAGLSLSVVPLRTRDVRPAPLPSSGWQTVLAALTAARDGQAQPERPAPARQSVVDSGSTAGAAAAWDRDGTEDASPGPLSAPVIQFEDGTTAPLPEDTAAVPVDVRLWRQAADGDQAGRLALPERAGEAATPAAPDAVGSARSPWLAFFALLGGAGWVGASEPEANRSRPRPPARRPGG